jgi:hypothetical protein
MKSWLLGFVVLIAAACGGGAPDVGEGTATTSTSLLGEEALASSVSSDACALSDPWEMVETAFVGTVTDIDVRVNEGRQFELEERGLDVAAAEWPWVTFEVESWFTNDYGTRFSMWSPGFEGAVGETWQIAGALYWVNEQSGEVFSCLSVPEAESDLSAWEDRFGGSIVAGTDTPENPADPAVLAEIDANRRIWESKRPESYTAIVTVFADRQPTNACGGSTSVRLVVENGDLTEAVDLRRLCRVSDLDFVYTVEDVFSVATEAAGAVEGEIVFDEDYGFVTGFSAFDRSIEVNASVNLLAETAAPASLGTEASLAAVDDALRRWDAADIDSYTMTLDVECFCTIGGSYEVTVVDGRVETIRRLDDLNGPPQSDSFDFTVEGLLASLTSWSGATPDSVIAGFHELGYPVDIHIDAITNAVDDELTLFVKHLEPNE